MIPGRVLAENDGGVTLDTAYGELVGAALGQRAGIGSEASLAVPAEAIDVLPLSTPREQLIAVYGGAAVKARVKSVEQVGHIVQIAAAIGAAEPILVEGHADKYAVRHASGAEVLLAWRRDAATLIAH